MCWTLLYANNVNKTCALLQTTVSPLDTEDSLKTTRRATVRPPSWLWWFWNGRRRSSSQLRSNVRPPFMQKGWGRLALPERALRATREVPFLCRWRRTDTTVLWTRWKLSPTRGYMTRPPSTSCHYSTGYGNTSTYCTSLSYSGCIPHYRELGASVVPFA